MQPVHTGNSNVISNNRTHGFMKQGTQKKSGWSPEGESSRNGLWDKSKIITDAADTE